MCVKSQPRAVSVWSVVREEGIQLRVMKFSSDAVRKVEGCPLFMTRISDPNFVCDFGELSKIAHGHILTFHFTSNSSLDRLFFHHHLFCHL